MGELNDINLASRKAEEAAGRRFEAAGWLESLVGPLGIPSNPSEKEFITCLRNGLILCNAVNKIQPGAVPKVVENHITSPSLAWASQPLPAYQYFENVRNFLVAAEEMNIIAFEASDLERDNLEAGSTAKVVDCVLAMKSYHEWKQRGNGVGRLVKSPMVMNSASRTHSRGSSADSCRLLDMPSCEREPVGGSEVQKHEGLVAKALAECIVGAKENIDDNLLASYHSGNQDATKSLSRIPIKFLEDQLLNNFPQVKSVLSDLLIRGGNNNACSTSAPLQELFPSEKPKCCRCCAKKGICRHWRLIQAQERDIFDLKALLSRTKMEFKGFQSQLQSDLNSLGSQLPELSIAALGYQKVVRENRDLHNMVIDLKGNIRVYCRIRPAFKTDTKNVIDLVGVDGSIVISDPSKPQKDGRKIFQFNRVFGPSATQDEVYADTQPLIRSVMDGYNVCIFAYGQTGSGKTHTMSGPSCGLTKDSGINYLALNDLFQISYRRKDLISYEIHVQMVEIYNEQVRDLLAEDSTTTKLEIRSCTTDSGLKLPNATMRSVKCPTDILNLMKIGETNRVVSSTAINNRSSRSHCVLTVHVHGKENSGGITRSCLHLVDLAGSERVDKSEVTGDRLKEAQYINKSLSCLGDVITALALKSSHVPYRNSKLTLLLQDSLGGRAKTLMFAHVSPEGDSFSETFSTLNFAQRVSSVELGSARVMNRQTSEVLELKAQIENLKKALANKEARCDQSYKPQERCERPQPMALTPSRPRRASIENSGRMLQTERSVNFEDKKEGSKSIPARARRFSTEGLKYAKKENLQIMETSLPIEAVVSEKCDQLQHALEVNFEDKKGGSKSIPARARRLSLESKKYGKKGKPQFTETSLPPVEAVTSEQCDQFQHVQAVSKSYGHFNNDKSTMDIHRSKTPQRYKTSSYNNQVVETESEMIIKTPERLPAESGRKIQMQENIMYSSNSFTANLNADTNGKKSQIRKSLRNIGKLINGSEKRKQRVLVEAPTQMIGNGGASINHGTPHVTNNSRALRRQSLTGRSSLGGSSTDSCPNQPSITKTPPPVTATRMSKRWL